MVTASKQVSGFLEASSHAQVLGHVDLGAGRSSTIWRNWDDRVRYDAPDGHTLSLYLCGGTGTFRIDGRYAGRGAHGWPGTVCLMPQGRDSAWVITQPFTFIHLYLSDGDLRRMYAESFDRDARLMDVADRTYVEAEDLAGPFRSLVRAVRCGDPVSAEEASLDLIASMFASGRFGETRRLPLSGGLSPRVLRLLREAMEAHLDRPIRLRDLADIAGLSECHLQRSFRESCGISPQMWLTHRRVERAKALIRSGEPLAQVAVACGFSSQSHLSTVFKKGTGATPGAYRASQS